MKPDPAELLRVEGLSKFFPVVQGVFGKTVGHVRAVDDISLSIQRGETLGLVGESGCGKTTAGRSILRLIEPSRGRIWFDGADITALSQAELRKYRRRMQIIFQDPFGSLNPRRRVVDIVGEAIEAHGLAHGTSVEGEVREILRRVGLAPTSLNRYPHEFSGGQRQRIGVARAIAVSPELIVCDEAVSALDVSIQAQVINLLADLRREMNLAYLFIAHDLSVVRHISERVAVMYLGKLVELGPSADLFREPAHPYTRALLSAIVVPDPRRRRVRLALEGEMPSPLDPPSGCHFHPRCPAAVERCREQAPPLVQLDAGRRQVRCVHAEGLENERAWFDVVERRISEATTARTRPATATRVRANVLTRARLVRPVAAPPPESLMASRGPGLAVTAGPLLGRMARRVPLWWLLAGLVVAGALGARWVEPARRAAKARDQLNWLAAELTSYEKNVGHLPKTLADLRFRTVERFGIGTPRDPWGRPFRYARHDGAIGFELSSDGSDGTASGDDIMITGAASVRAERR